jgi:haloalkane dehalogenase
MRSTVNCRPPGVSISAGRIPVGNGHVAYRMRGGDDHSAVLAVFHQSPLSGWTHEPLFAELRHPGPVILFDTPGYGDSSDARALARIEDYASRLGAALEELRSRRRVVVLGQHTGGHLALLYAAAHPDATAGVIFHGLSLYTDAERRERAARYAPPIEHNDDGDHLRSHWDRIRELYPRVDIALRDRMIADYLIADPDYAHAYRAVFACDVAPLAAAFAATAIPSRVIVGTEDVIYHTQRRVVERFGSDFIALPGLTDFAPWEAPAEFAAAVDEFIAKVASRSGK